MPLPGIRLKLLFAALALTVLAAAPAAAAESGDSLLLSTAGEAIEDTRFEAQAVGRALIGRDLLVRIAEDEALPCPSSPGLAGSGPVDAISGRVEGAFTTFQRITITDPGTYRLCGWLLDEGTDTARARDSLLVVVRPARAGVGISVPSLALTGQRIRFTAAGGSELSRLAFFSLRPAALGCSGATAKGAAGRFGRVWEVAGPFVTTSSFDPVASAGELLLCGAVIEADGDPDPEAAAVAAIRVVDRKQVCSIATEARAGADKRAGAAFRSFRRNQRLARRHPGRAARYNARKRRAGKRYDRSRTEAEHASTIADHVC